MVVMEEGPRGSVLILYQVPNSARVSSDAYNVDRWVVPICVEGAVQAQTGQVHCLLLQPVHCRPVGAELCSPQVRMLES